MFAKDSNNRFLKMVLKNNKIDVNNINIDLEFMIPR